MLPIANEKDNSLFLGGISYLNEYYKIIGKLDKINGIEIGELSIKFIFSI